LFAGEAKKILIPEVTETEAAEGRANSAALEGKRPSVDVLKHFFSSSLSTLHRTSNFPLQVSIG
jgi:hypothetical protein